MDEEVKKKSVTELVALEAHLIGFLRTLDFADAQTRSEYELYLLVKSELDMRFKVGNLHNNVFAIYFNA